MDRIYFTRVGIKKFLLKISADEGRLKEMYSRLAELADVGGNQYHDNFSYEQQMRDINMLSTELGLKKKLLANFMVLDYPTSIDRIAIGVTVVIDRDGIEERWTVVGYDESNPEAGKIAYNSPFGKALIGKKVHEEVNFRRTKIVIKKLLIPEMET